MPTNDSTVDELPDLGDCDRDLLLALMAKTSAALEKESKAGGGRWVTPEEYQSLLHLAMVGLQAKRDAM